MTTTTVVTTTHQEAAHRQESESKVPGTRPNNNLKPSYPRKRKEAPETLDSRPGNRRQYAMLPGQKKKMKDNQETKKTICHVAWPTEKNKEGVRN